jgi:hypothetical protein
MMGDDEIADRCVGECLENEAGWGQAAKRTECDGEKGTGTGRMTTKRIAHPIPRQRQQPA